MAMNLHLFLCWLCLSCWVFGIVEAWSSSSRSNVCRRNHQQPSIFSRLLRPLASSSSSSSSSSSTSSSSTNNNIVLRPSEDPTAFDSFKIGSPRVHRYYARQNNPDEPLYVMWYHGRSRNVSSTSSSSSSDDQHHQHQNNNNGAAVALLPPLSTGRIGRAISNNGLAWERDLMGSASEDVPAVSLGLNKESWWGFDTTHVGLGQVLLPMLTPAIRTDSGVYLMYFFGGNYEETALSDYLPTTSTTTTTSSNNNDNNINKNEVKIQGMKMRIGVAVSQDGISFGRVECDDPTGACVTPYDANDPNAKNNIITRDDDNNSDSKLEEELYCAWPEVVATTTSEDEEGNDPRRKNSNDDGNNFFMYYSTMEKATKEKCIALAVSPDGFRWFKRGICLRPSSPSSTSEESKWDAGGCARCCVIQKARFDSVISQTWKSTFDGWQMYYEGVSPEDGKHRIMVAESPDGRVWQKKGLALDVGESGDAWDAFGVGSPHILRLDDGAQRMYYVGQSADGSTAIGVARLDLNAASWVREQASFSFV